MAAFGDHGHGARVEQKIEVADGHGGDGGRWVRPMAAPGDCAIVMLRD
jgi:hypothetical protein